MPTSPLQLEITFLLVSDIPSKLARITGVIEHHYYAGDRITVFVPNSQSADYMDQLLWRHPPLAVLPHAISLVDTQETIAITTSSRNVNHANLALNLSPIPCPAMESYEKIYELYDQTDIKKRVQSEDKLKHYRSLGLAIHGLEA